VQSQWSRSQLKASRLSPRYWSFTGLRYHKRPSAVSRQPSAALGASGAASRGRGACRAQSSLRERRPAARRRSRDSRPGGEPAGRRARVVSRRSRVILVVGSRGRVLSSHGGRYASSRLARGRAQR
jgi:hypothetical protein